MWDAELGGSSAQREILLSTELPKLLQHLKLLADCITLVCLTCHIALCASNDCARLTTIGV